MTRNILCPLTYANMELNKDSNIAVNFSVVRCYELNRSFYCTDSSNYKRNTYSYQNFSHISKKYIKFTLFDLSYKKQLETFTAVCCCSLLTTRTKRVSIIPLRIRRGIYYRDLFSCYLGRCADTRRHTGRCPRPGRYTARCADTRRHTGRCARTIRHTGRYARTGRHTGRCADTRRHTGRCANTRRHTRRCARTG